MIKLLQDAAEIYKEATGKELFKKATKSKSKGDK
jgi:hypothetical protein